MRGPLLLVALATMLALHAAGDFAGVAGFSGRRGADCTSCHTDAPEPASTPGATAILEGLPQAWDPDAVYALTVRVEGGPEALAAPAPQGGFELEVDAGGLLIPAGQEDLLRRPYPTIMTYTPEGTMMREWIVEWQAPGLEAEPEPAGVWLAVLSANGNHVVATNVSDGGERGDAAATLHAAVPPSAAALEAWQEMPLAAPVVTAGGPFATSEPVLVKGQHGDANATAIAWRVNGGAWQTRDAIGAWWIQLPNVPAGNHTLEIRSLGAGRESSVLELPFTVEGGFLPIQESPAPMALLLVALLFAHTRRTP